MPPQDVSKLVFQIFDMLANGKLLGYVLFSLVSVGWFVHAKWQRRIMSEEIDRVSQERNLLQEKAIDAPIESSEPRKRRQPVRKQQ